MHGIFPPLKHGGTFSQRYAFHVGTNFFGQIYGGLFYMGEIIIRSCQDMESHIFQFAFASNLNTAVSSLEDEVLTIL